jgi:molecular chaperone GrpE (heat shock protein)
MNQHTETKGTDEQTYAESQQFEQSAPGSSSGNGLTTADIASGRQSPNREPSEEQPANLLPEDRLTSLREQWSEIQTSFVDEPKSSVQKADELVADVIQTLAKRFAEERDTLERQWSGGGDASTEDLRKALQHYRSFFERLLAA